MLLNIKSLAPLVFFMSARIRKRKAMSRRMFHPSYSLTREPTFRQKRGVVLQRTPSCTPVLNTVVKKRDIEAARELLKNYHEYPDVTPSRDFITEPFQISIEIPANDTLTFGLNDENILGYLFTEKGINVENVLTAVVDDFIIYNPNGYSCPQVSYTYHYVDDSINSPSTANTTVNNVLYSVQFNHPQVSGTSSSISVLGPRLYRNSSYQACGFVTFESIKIEGPSDPTHSILDSFSEGVTYFPWYGYKVGSENVIYTGLTVDNTNLPQTKQLYVNGIVTHYIN